MQTLPVILNPAVVRGKGRPRGSKNKEKGHGVTATRRDPSQFEYAPSSSAPAVLGRPQAESAAVQDLLAHHEQEEQDNGGFIDIDEFDEAMIDPQLRSPQLQSPQLRSPQLRSPQLRSTTQIGIARIESSTDTYCPGTLPPRLHQTNPFSLPAEEVIDTSLAPQIQAPTAQELQDIADQEEDEQNLSQAIEALMGTTRVGRKRKATYIVKENIRQDREQGRDGKRGGQSGRARKV
jgi:hypothetical protein